MSDRKILEKSYDPEPVEKKWADFWIDNKLFTPEASSDKKKFSMVLPPPNVTGSLHMGHALCFTLPDIIVRWKRMQGYNVLWLPGTDHASIAVHNVIERKLDKEGIKKEDISREEFLKIAWDWKEKYGGKIIHQLKKLGFSLDWTRERFTLDKGFSRAVKKVFVDLYKENLIYRDYYLVNRCPKCRTVLSDIEIEHKELQSKLYYIKYPVKDSDDTITVATTRPETMLGDTAVAVHPNDKRFKKYHGKKAVLPLVGREIPVIKDKSVDREFGTGAVKVTPAHDTADFEMGKRHGLDQVIVIDGKGEMTEAAGEEFKGLNRFECREQVVSQLRKQGFIEKIEDYVHSVGHCYRCKTVIEPYLSWQWFVKIESLAKQAISVVKKGRIRFIPSNWSKTYFEWMYNIHDWCISRQLWWGHRIPAWHCQECGQIIVAEEPPSKCDKCGSSQIKQDEDVLDTWFSSALWPFGTMGWPEKTDDLSTFYPTDLMSTGFDIIFFWVARMIMMGLKFMGDIPFKEVYINGLVRDFKRRKMSKSEGNIIDPLDMIENYGTDALRFTLAALAAPGMDISLSEERMAGYRAFVNKIWNASRFVLMNIQESVPQINRDEMTVVDRWIRARLNDIAGNMNDSLAKYNFHEAAETIYHFIWHEFCDWYLELVKPDLKKGNRSSLGVLVDTLDKILRLIHPFMPFVTEEIWQKLPVEGKSLVVAGYPGPDKSFEDRESEDFVNMLKDIIVEVRTIRSENHIVPQRKIDLIVISADENIKDKILRHKEYICSLASVKDIEVSERFPSGKKLLKGVAGNVELAIPIESGLIDFKVEKKRLERELQKITGDIEKLQKRMRSKDFIERAPEKVIKETKQGLKEMEEKREKLERNLGQINEWSSEV
ncbi:MAG TPA: valine--tRNA ligase [Candidatus Aminicenantes bacterium]|nr:valine--tRNA ligase [Candidatus Aminicenantes bacterium]